MKCNSEEEKQAKGGSKVMPSATAEIYKIVQGKKFLLKLQ